MAKQGRNTVESVAMITAFVAIGAFTYWLWVMGGSNTVAVAVESAPEPQASTLVLSPAQFAQDPASYVGENVVIDGAVVSSLLGPHVFFMEIGPGILYVVRVAPALVSGGLELSPGDQTRLEGMVTAMSDSVRAGWQTEGIFEFPAQFDMATSAPTFIHATSIEIQAAAPASTGQE